MDCARESRVETPGFFVGRSVFVLIHCQDEADPGAWK
jgi:hypothetical protein